MNAALKHPPGVTDVAGAPPEPLTPLDTLPHWYALWVMSNAEFTVLDALYGYQIEAFLPTWTEITQWSDRKKTIRRPLFPGYLFVRCDAKQRVLLTRIAGVIEVLPTSMNPLPVDPAEIENVRRALAAGLPMKPCAYVSGDEVVIDSGPLAGVKGIVQRTKNGTRVVVKIEMLQRAVSVEIDALDLMKATA
jgi:transcriptional antiterminator NusG